MQVQDLPQLLGPPHGRAIGIRKGRTGAVTFIQRFGNAINLNPHLHTVMPDGLFVEGPGEELTFENLPPPSAGEIQALTLDIGRRIARLAEAAGVGRDEGALVPAEDMTEYAQVTADALVPPAPPSVLRAALKDAEPPKGLCANVDGFVLHAALPLRVPLTHIAGAAVDSFRRPLRLDVD